MRLYLCQGYFHLQFAVWNRIHLLIDIMDSHIYIEETRRIFLHYRLYPTDDEIVRVLSRITYSKTDQKILAINESVSIQTLMVYFEFSQPDRLWWFLGV